jgi:hypothetical protein
MQRRHRRRPETSPLPPAGGALKLCSQDNSRSKEADMGISGIISALLVGSIIGALTRDVAVAVASEGTRHLRAVGRRRTVEGQYGCCTC